MSSPRTTTDFPQMYETIISDPSTGLALQFIVVPARSLEDTSILDDAIQAMEQLNVKPHCTIKESRITRGLTAVLMIHEAEDPRLNDLDSLVNEAPETYRFAEIVASSNVIPFESSPAALQALLDIVKTGSGVKIGAALGFYVGLSIANPLLLFITVPAGMIICGAAQGIAEGVQEGTKDGLKEGLKFRIIKLFKGKKR